MSDYNADIGDLRRAVMGTKPQKTPTKQAKSRTYRPALVPKMDLVRWAVRVCASNENVTFDDLSVLLVALTYGNGTSVSTWPSSLIKDAFGDQAAHVDDVMNCLDNLAAIGIIGDLAVSTEDPDKVQFVLRYSA